MKYGKSLSVGCLAVTLIPCTVSAQITHGQKPNLPGPRATKSAGNGPGKVEAPVGFLPTVPSGFHVNIFAKDFKVPRLLTVAPNGDIFLAETGADQVVILRDPQHTGGAQERIVFADGLRRPFGIAFHDDYVYIGNMTSLVRFKYDIKTSKRLGESEKLLDFPAAATLLLARSLSLPTASTCWLLSARAATSIPVSHPSVPPSPYAISTAKMPANLPPVCAIQSVWPSSRSRVWLGPP
jgi:glucose/arabinose dehydrogenase